MTPITRGQKIFFVVAGLSALWVGTWCFFVPSRVDWALPWLVPPLHARFLGAIYLSAAAFLAGGILARHYAEVRIMVRVATIFTGMVFVLSLIHLGEIDNSGRLLFWIWFVAYLVYPLSGLWLIWRDRDGRKDDAGHSGAVPLRGEAGLPGWARGWLLTQGLVLALLGAAALFVPASITILWPWKITPLLAHIYLAPFLAYGAGSLMLSRQRAWMEARVVVIGFFVFAVGALAASIIHRGLFNFSGPAAWVWFGSFSVAAVMLGLMSARSIRAGGSS